MLDFTFWVARLYSFQSLFNPQCLTHNKCLRKEVLQFWGWPLEQPHKCGWGRPFWIARSRHISAGPSVNWETRIWQYHSHCPVRLCRAGNLGPGAQADLLTVAGWTVGAQGSSRAWLPSLSCTVEALPFWAALRLGPAYRFLSAAFPALCVTNLSVDSLSVSHTQLSWEEDLIGYNLQA